MKMLDDDGFVLSASACPQLQYVAGITLVLLVTSAGRHNKHGHSRPLIRAEGMLSARTRAVATHLSRSVMQSHSRVTRVTVNQVISGEHYLIGNRTVDGGCTLFRSWWSLFWDTSAPTMDPAISQLILIHDFILYFRANLILSYRLWLRLASGLVPSGNPSKMWGVLNLMRATCLDHLFPLNIIILTVLINIFWYVILCRYMSGSRNVANHSSNDIESQ
jgi:hypothetical protein